MPNWKPNGKRSNGSGRSRLSLISLIRGTWPAEWKRDVPDGPGNRLRSQYRHRDPDLDMNGYADFQTIITRSKATECGPAGFCALTGTAPNTTCTCQLDAADPLFNDCQ